MQSERAAVAAAFAAHPASAAARQAALRPRGLVAAYSPLDELEPLGLSRFSGVTFSPRHMIYEGIWCVFVEASFRKLREAVATTAAFNATGKAIDAWVVTAAAPCPFIKTAFKGGMSRYFYSALTNPGQPWAASRRRRRLSTDCRRHRRRECCCWACRRPRPP